MREHVRSTSHGADPRIAGAAARRDERLARVRKLSLWITGGAAVATLGLGTAFAHALPGHSVSDSTVTGTASSSSSAVKSGRAASASATPRSHSSAAPAPARSASTPKKAADQGLSAPASKPAPAQAPAVVQSGGS